jgi:gliding motility-associated-like protein
MFKRIFLFFLFAIFISLNTFSAVFVVTSNADSGPGTLREALTLAAANGSVDKDYINFNLPDLSEAGRTILLVSQLPDLSSNLDIDGSTQPGIVFGQSNAHVKVSTPINYKAFQLFNGTGLTNVGLYGLYLYDYTGTNTSGLDQLNRNGINISKSTNIELGAIGKGNLMRGFNQYMIFFDEVDGVKIQSNVLGLGKNNDLDGDEMQGYDYSAGIILGKCNNILIGGSLAEANFFFCNTNIYFAQNSSGNKLSVKFNNFGVFQDNKSITYMLQAVFYMVINTEGLTNYFVATDEVNKSAVSDINIENNLGGNFANVFRLFALKGNINFYNNNLGVTRDGLTSLNEVSHPNEGTPIFFANCFANITIGGNDPTKKNFIAFADNGISATNSPNILLRNNDFQCFRYRAYSIDAGTVQIPITIDKVTTVNMQTTVYGTSQPGATVDLYNSESCKYANCSIRSYLQTTVADNAGNWQANLANFSGLFYASATLNGRTSEYKTISINEKNMVIQHLRCDAAKITGLQVTPGVNYYWTDKNGNVVSTDIDLTTTKPGDYQLVIGNGCITSPWYHVQDIRIQIFDYSLVKNDASCGGSTGAIKGLFVYDPLSKISGVKWTNVNNTVVGTTTDIAVLPAGAYTLIASTTDGCTKTYGPIVLKSIGGPNIDQNNTTIQPTNCGQSTGSITGITATGSGTLKYSWTNSTQQVVSTTRDLTNQPAGQYTLQVTDDSQCGPVYTSAITIPETNGITLDDSNVQTAVASCSNANGSVTNIQVTGATQYKWVDASGKTVATTSDLKNVISGDYVFTASNNFGCSKTQTYHVGQQVATVYPAYTNTIVNSCFGQNNGSITVTTDALVKSLRWENSRGTTVGTNSSLINASSGNYKLYLTDQNGCENLYNSYVVTEIPELKIIASTEQVSNDQCNLKSGSIKNIQISGGLPPYTYSWLNGSNNIISSSIDVASLAMGSYTLKVSDVRNCGEVIATYNILDQENIISAPLADNVQTCSTGDVLVKIKYPSTKYTYRLYDSESSLAPLDEQARGSFKVTVKSNITYYVSQISGSCESSRTAVRVSVGISSSDIANIFTPNGDGINDYWVIKGIENSPTALVQIFDRNGQKLFESKGYAQPFDGTFNGKPLPVGAYYYIINMGTNCKLLSGSLTIIR